MQIEEMNINTRKKQILKKFPDLLKGCLTHTSRSCGKANCKRCQSGQKHPVYNFAFTVNGKKKVVTISPKQHKQVQKLIDNWHSHKDLIEKLTEINVELIKKGKYKE